MVLLQHSGIVSVIELFEESGRLYLVLEYVPGRDLKSLIREVANQRKTIPAPITVFIALKICEALEYAHGCEDETSTPLGIIHRDVTPSNILMSVTGEVKLSDFGIAKARTRVQASITGRLQGKFVYMSRNKHWVNAWTLALISSPSILFYTRCSRSGDHLMPKMSRVFFKSSRMSDRKTDNPDFGYRRNLEAIVIKLLSKDPAQRYDSASLRALNSTFSQMRSYHRPLNSVAF